MLKILRLQRFPEPHARPGSRSPEKGLSDVKVEFISVDVPGGEKNTGFPAFAEKNPYATVPVIELEDGTCISECTAITEYVDNLVGEPVLTGRNAKDRAIIHMMQRRTEAGLLDAAATYFHHATPGLGPKIEIYQNREWGEKNRKHAISRHALSRPGPGQATVSRRQRLHNGRHHCVRGPVYAAIAKVEVPWRTGQSEILAPARCRPAPHRPRLTGSALSDSGRTLTDSTDLASSASRTKASQRAFHRPGGTFAKDRDTGGTYWCWLSSLARALVVFRSSLGKFPSHLDRRDDCTFPFSFCVERRVVLLSVTCIACLSPDPVVELVSVPVSVVRS